jgi:hypothetical protein
MSDNESSNSDMECDDVTEGATVRVVQSSMHASIKQNSLFKVVENKKESDDEEPKNQKIEPPPPEPVQDPPKVQPAEVPKE